MRQAQMKAMTGFEFSNGDTRSAQVIMSNQIVNAGLRSHSEED